MATIWGRLFNRNTVADEIARMRDGLANLTNQNAQLQSLLNISFRNQGGFARFDNVNQQDLILNGYEASGAVYSIISDIAMKGASVPMKVSYVINDYELKNYKLAASAPPTKDNILTANRLRKKALQQVEPDNDLQRLCNDPCPDMDPTLFWETAIGFDLICGNSFLYTPVLDIGADKGKVTEMQIMPSPYTGLIILQGYPPKVIGYELIIAGVQLLRTTEVIHIRQPNYNWTIDGQQLYGLPPLRAGRKTLARSNSAEVSSTAMFENGGPGVIVYNESIPPDRLGLEQTSKIVKNNNDNYAGNLNRGKVKYMPGKIGTAELGLSPVDLNILESEKFTFDMLCNIYKLHSVLYNIHVSSNFNNIEQLSKDNWISGYLPPRQRQVDAINRHIVPGYNTAKQKYFVELDISGIEQLQPNRTEMAAWSSKIPISLNEQRELFRLEARNEPYMDKIWIESGRIPAEDATIDVTNLPNMPQDQQNQQQ